MDGTQARSLNFARTMTPSLGSISIVVNSSCGKHDNGSAYWAVEVKKKYVSLVVNDHDTNF